MITLMQGVIAILDSTEHGHKERLCYYVTTVVAGEQHDASISYFW